jgi:hypothetical protein
MHAPRCFWNGLPASKGHPSPSTPRTAALKSTFDEVLPHPAAQLALSPSSAAQRCEACRPSPPVDAEAKAGMAHPMLVCPHACVQPLASRTCNEGASMVRRACMSVRAGWWRWA